jgi:putative ABC transport system permease protein
MIAQLLVECLPLAVGGAVAGLVIAAWGLQALMAMLPPDVVPAESRIEVNGAVILFTGALALGTVALSALVPAWEVSRSDVGDSLKEGSRGSAGRRSGRIRAGLIVAEVGLSLTLLVGAGLLLRSFSRLQAIDPGFDASHLLVLPVQLPAARYPEGPAATRFFEELVSRTARIPGVRAAAASSNVPFSGGTGLPLVVEGKTYTDLNELQGVQFSLVVGDFLRAHGLRLLRGRTFAETDREGSLPVILLNEAAVKRFLPEGDPIGKRVLLGIPENLITPGMLPKGLDRFEWATVVGVVSSARHFGLRSEFTPTAYVPASQSWPDGLIRRSMTLMLRTEGEPANLAPAVRQVLWSLDRNQPAASLNDMEGVIARSLQQSRFSMVLLGIFAVLALVLAAVGIYGVVSWNVTQRTRELGIRQALGATREQLLGLVVRQGMTLVGLGLLLGLAAAFAATHSMQTLLYEISVVDPWTFVLVPLGLAVIALLACLMPARRATRLDPMAALRAE